MKRLRRLAALGAACGAVAFGLVLAVVSPADAHLGYAPRIEYCHFWPHLTEVHWDSLYLAHVYGSPVVVAVKFEWSPALGPTLFQERRGGENEVAATPLAPSLFSGQQAAAVLTLDNGMQVPVGPKGCLSVLF